MKYSRLKKQASNYLSYIFLMLAILFLAACSREPENPADMIITGGDILTMAGEQPQYVEALAVDDGKISFLGSKLETDKLVGKTTQQIDLHGTTVIPSVVSGVQQILTLQGAANAPNCWKQASFNTSAELIAALKIAQAEREKLGLGLFCLGYVPNTSNANDVLTEASLDASFPETSVILVDASLQNVLTNNVAKQKFTLGAYKVLKNAVQKSDQKSIGLQVGLPADFMIIDRNPLKDKSVPLTAIKILQTFVQGKPVLDAPKNLGMLAILDIFSAYTQELAAKAKLDEMNAVAAAAAAEKEKQKQQQQAAAAKAKSTADAKAKASASAKPLTKKTVSYTKGNRQVKEVVKAPAAEPAVAAAPSKPNTARFNMTQDGKKMTAEDFDAWMKAQGIRIVPANPPAEAVKAGDDKK